MRTDLDEQIRGLIDGGARPVSFAEATARRPATGPRHATAPRPATAPGRRRPRRLVVVAAAGAAVVAAAAITVGLTIGGSGGSGGTSAAKQPGHADTVLTAAMVRQVVAASGVALAHAGHIRITYSDVSPLDPGDYSAGTDDITFSGRNWNYITDQTAPPNGQSINRFVGGDLYYYGEGFVQHPGDPLHWLRETNPAEIHDVTSVTAPDPGKLLRVLDPAARFVQVGSGVVGGVKVEHLRATRLGHLPGLSALPGDAAPIGHVTSLEVWVDGHGVIRQLRLISQRGVTTGGKQQYAVKKNGKVTVVTSGSAAPVRHGVEQATATISFLDVGQPQSIKAPASSVPVFSRG